MFWRDDSGNTQEHQTLSVLVEAASNIGEQPRQQDFGKKTSKIPTADTARASDHKL